jgi:hypothetical protein
VAYNGLLPDQPNLGEEEKERGLRLGAPVRVTLDDLPDNALPSQPTGGGVGDAPTSELTLKDIPRDVLPENWEQRVLDVNHRQSQNTTPDRAAEIAKASELTGADPGVLERNPALVEDSFQRQSMDALAKNSPAVATYLQNLENYKVSKDDLEALSATERVLAGESGALKSGAKVAGRFFPTAASITLNALGLISGAFDAAAGLVERIPGITPRGELPFVGNLTGHKPVFAGMRDELYGLAETTEKFWLEKDFLNLPEDLRRKRLIDHPELLFNKEWMVFTIGEGINSLGAMLLAAYATGGGYGVAAIFGGGAEGGAMHRELLSKGKASEEDAINYSMLYAGASAWLNSLGIEAIFGRKAARNVAERFVKSLVAGGAEGLTEYAEEPTQAFLSGLAEDDTPKELIDRVAESLKNVEMFVAGAGAGGTMSYLNQSYEMSDARRQQEQKDFFNALNEAAASSKTRERLPAAYARAVQEIQKKHGGVVDTVYIDAELFQEVVMSDEQRADLSESIGIPVEQLSERIATGAKIPVPIDLFAANVAGTDRAPLISPYLSFSEEGLSSQQAAIIREGLDDELRRQIDLINIQAESENQFDIERNQVYEDMQARLAPAVAAGRMSKDEADQAALLWTAHAATFATSYPSFGMSPMQVHRSMNPDVQADSWADRIAKANRAAGEEAFQNYLKSPEFKAWFGNSAAVDAEGNPLILKHGTNTGGYTTFDTDGRGKTDGTGAFFTVSHYNAKTYTETDRLIDTPTPEEALANLEDYGLYIEKGEDSQGVYYTAYDGYGNSYSADTELEAVEGVLLEGSESQEGIYEVFLSIQNPLIVEANGANWDSIGQTWVVYDTVAKEPDWFGSQEEAEEEADRLIEEYLSDPEEYPDFDPETDIEVKLDEFSGHTTDDIAREAREEGYDGVIFIDIYDNGTHSGYSDSTDVYVVFDPTQVKSATYNVGTFDPKNPDIRYQQDSVLPEGLKKWLNWEPEVTSTGNIKGAPPWVKTRKDHNAMRRQIAKFAREGLISRYWYEQSAQRILDLVQGEVEAAEKIFRLIAIYSPQADVDTNMNYALQAWKQFKEKVPREAFKVRKGIEDQKAIAVLYDSIPFSGRKTNSFYLNLMQPLLEADPSIRERLGYTEEDIKALNLPVTVDIWAARAFGYDNENPGNDKGDGAYSFMESEIRRAAARMSVPGDIWLPHQVQAAVWTAVKARYEEPETRMAFIQEAAKKGFLVKGSEDRLKADKVPGLSREQEIEYMAIRRKHAMKLTSARVEALAAENHFDFASAIGRRTWSAAVEAVPSVVLGAEIAEASPGVKREFTEESKELLLGPNGEDLLAEQLGVPFALVQTGRGAYEGEANPNFLAHLVPVKRNGIFQRDEARAYAWAVQYIYRQEAVPIMRADPRAVATQAGKKAAMFRVIGPNGRTVPGSVVATLKAAQEIAESKGEGYRVQGGPYSRGVEITFSQDISDLQSEAVLSSLEEFLGDNGLGFTQVTPDTLAIVNFRGDEDGIPFMMDDEAFIRQLDAFIKDRGEELGIIDAKSLWYEGEYGKVHDWAKDPQGEEIINTRGITERPGLPAWIRDRRAEAEAIVEKYSSERLAAMESAQRGERFQRAVEEEPAGTELPVGKDGRVGLIHWSSVPGLTELDPARHGTGIKGAESKRKKNDPKNWVDRTYFGVEGGGYSREPFLGSNQYRTSVLPGRLYDFSADPDGLMARAKEEAQGNPFIEVLSVYERLIRDARYDGYYTDHPSMGTVAAVFYPTEVVKVEQGPDRLERFSSEANQEGTFVPKGSFQPRTDGTSLISLFETADASTFLHETGHAFFRFMEQMAALPEAPPELIRDWQILKEAVGYQEGQGPLSEAQDETLARMWERYFLQGEAPSLKLRTVFQRFGDWLKAIYRNIRLMNTPVSAEVEGVFKRMLATESEIAEAQDYADMKEPFFAEADLISEENRKYREARKRAKAEAEERRYRKYVKAFLQAMGGKKKLKKDIENQLSASPLYSAIDEVIALGGFNLEMVDALIGSEARRELTKKYRGLVKSKGTIIPEEVAEDKGYASVHDLLKMMVEEPKKKIKVEEILNAEFERLKNDIPPANEDIHSDTSLSVLLAELQILNSKRRSLAGLEAARQVQFEITAVREVARKVLAEKPLGEAIGHYPYSQAELRAARRARKAYLEGDLELAEQMKRRQLLNHALVLEAINARRDYDAAMKRIKKAAKRDMDEAYMHQLQGLLFKFGIYNNPPPEGTVSFAAFMEGLSNIDPDDPATLTVPIWSSWMFNEDKVPRGERQTYKTTLTYEDFKELNDAIVWLSGRGVDIKKGRLAAYAENLKELTEELIQPAMNLKDRKVYRKGTWLRRLSDEARAYIADHEMLTFILDMMDGFTNAGPKGFFGPNRKKIGNVLADRQSKRDRMMRDAADVLKPLFKQLSESMAKYPRFLNTSVPVPELIKRDGDAWTFEKVLAVALNMGNATNLKRLEDGLGIDLEAALELTSILTKEDWDAIQKIWDHVNSYWPELNEVHYRINHFHQKKVEAQEIEVRTADGGTVVLKGGYYPIKYDGNLAKKVDEWTEKDDLLQASVWGHPGVKAGMTKERVATVKLPLALNLTVLFGHLEDTIHYITHADVIRDLDRVTQSSDYQRVMEDKFGQQIYRMIRPTLRHIARPERIIGLMMDKHMTRLRALSTAYVLGLNFSVAAKQVYSVPGAINDLGIGAYLRGIAQVLKHPVQGRRTMHEMSPYMETRSKSFDRDIRDGIGNLRPKGLGLKAGTLDQLRDFSFVLIRMMDFVAVYPTWWGAYKKSMAQQSDPEVAVRYADEIIRQSQPSAKPMDMSAMQRDQRGLTRAFSMFMTFVAKYGNRQRYYWRGWRAGQISNADYFRHVLLEAIAPPMLMNLMFAALWGNEPDEEDILIDMLVYQFSGYLLVREFAGMGGAFLKKYGLEKDGVFVPGLADSPAFEGLRIVQRSSGAIAAWLGDMEDDDKYGKAVWAFADLASFWVGVPAPKVAQKLLEGVRQFEEEDGTLPAILIPDPNKRQ